MRSDLNSFNKYGHIYDANELPHQRMVMSDDLGRYEAAYIPFFGSKKLPKEEYRADQPYQQMYYLDEYKAADEDMMYQKNYGIVRNILKEAVGLTEDTVKKLAKSTADNIIIPVGSYVAKNIVAPVGEHVAKEIVFPVGKYVSKEIAVPVGKYVAKEIAAPVGKYVAKEVALPIAKEVVAESQDIIKEITAESMKLTENFIKARIEQLKEDIKQEIKEMPGKVIEGIKGKIKLPFSRVETLDEADYDAYVKDQDEFAW